APVPTGARGQPRQKTTRRFCCRPDCMSMLCPGSGGARFDADDFGPAWASGVGSPGLLPHRPFHLPDFLLRVWSRCPGPMVLGSAPEVAGEVRHLGCDTNPSYCDNGEDEAPSVATSSVQSAATNHET